MVELVDVLWSALVSPISKGRHHLHTIPDKERAYYPKGTSGNSHRQVQGMYKMEATSEHPVLKMEDDK